MTNDFRPDEKGSGFSEKRSSCNEESVSCNEERSSFNEWLSLFRERANRSETAEKKPLVSIDVLTLFPEAFAPLSVGIMKRAQDKGLVEIRVENIRNHTLDKHGKCDDYAFGGGAGMVMTPQPIADAIRFADPDHKARRIYLSPRGKTLDQKTVIELAGEKRLLFLCGHYEGVDQRVIDGFIDEEISVGDYVLMGGELPAMVVIEALCRYVPGVLHSEDSTEEESFVGSLLEYPQYTRPALFEGMPVPDVLLSGHHGNIEKWRFNERVRITRERRPDLLEKANLPEEKPKKKKRGKSSRKTENVSSLNETTSLLNETASSLNENASSLNEWANPEKESAGAEITAEEK